VVSKGNAFTYLTNITILSNYAENSEEAYLFPCTVGEIGSNSNISVRLCEIEDSELEEFLPQQQTNN